MTDLKKNLTPAKYFISLLAMVVLIIGISPIYASGYDSRKFSGLAKQRYGDEAYNITLELQQLVNRLKSASETDKLNEINNFFNQKIGFAEDIYVWGKMDYWATPLESIGLEAVDCEDFSIAKYAFLKILNVSNDKLRLTYVRAVMPSPNGMVTKAHMVLSYKATPQSESLILDSLTPDILPATSRKDLTPIFSFNDKVIWVGSSPKPKSDALSHLSRWRDVLTRMHEDGIE